METLQLKHLAPYLPYELNGVDSIYPQLHFKLLGFKSSSPTTLIRPVWVYTGDKAEVANRWNCKPILRPLSIVSLRDIIQHEGECTTAIDEIYSDSWMAGGYTSRETEHGGLLIISNEDRSTILIEPHKPHTAMHWVWEKLVEMKFDVFGLIDKGLAVDMNELKEVET